MNKTKVLIIDDSALIRQTMTRLLQDAPAIEVVGTAFNPYNAVDKIETLKPDVILLDIQMPDMDGLTFLQKLMKHQPLPVIIFSSFVGEGSYNAIKALELGAVEVIEKPKFTTIDQLTKYKQRLIDAITAASLSKPLPKKINRTKLELTQKDSQSIFTLHPHIDPDNFIIAIGASTGGTEAIRAVLENLPPNLPPIVITQHMPVGFTKSFANRLDALSKLIVKEAEDNEPLRTGFAYIARGDRHLTITKRANKYYLKLLDTPPVNRHKPSVDVLFNSVADIFGRNSIGIILTGMGGDGANGLKKMKEKGAHTIAQDQETCVVFGMPRVAIEIGAVDKILPIYEIAPYLKSKLGTEQSFTGPGLRK